MKPAETVRTLFQQSTFVETMIYQLLHSKEVKSLPLLTKQGPRTRPAGGRNYISGMRRKARVHGRRTFKTYGKLRHV